MIKEHKVKRFIIYTILVVFLFTITACSFEFPKSIKVNRVVGVWGWTYDSRDGNSNDDSFRIKIAGINLAVIGLNAGVVNNHGIGIDGTNFHTNWQQPISLPVIGINILTFWNSPYVLDLFIIRIGI